MMSNLSLTSFSPLALISPAHFLTLTAFDLFGDLSIVMVNDTISITQRQRSQEVKGKKIQDCRKRNRLRRIIDYGLLYFETL
jgi:hypothetical protein